MADDGLAPCVAGASAAMVMTKFSLNILASASAGLKGQVVNIMGTNQSYFSNCHSLHDKHNNEKCCFDQWLFEHIWITIFIMLSINFWQWSC